MNHQDKTYLRFGLFLLFIILAGFLLYASSLVKLVFAVLDREGSSHGLFIPLLSGYFIWLKRNKIKQIELQSNYYGIVLLLSGIALAVFDSGVYQIEVLGFIIYTAGLIILFLGRHFFTEISFPLFFLVTMIPIPKEIYSAMANGVRDITLEGAIFITSLTGITYLREGILVELPNTTLSVNLSCSGIRYLISFFAFGLAYAYLSRKTVLSRIILVLLTFPVSIMASVFRLTAIFMLTYFFGPRMADFWPHVFISWSVFFTVLILCLVLDSLYLSRKKELELYNTKCEPCH